MPEPAWRSLFRDRDFLRLWLAGLASFIVRWLEMLAIGVFAYNVTHSAFIVAMLTMLRLLPMGLFGAPIGALADRMDRRQALLLCMLAQMAGSVSIAILALFDAVQVWHLGAAAFVNGIAWAADNPVRRAMMGQVAGPPRMSTAMSIDVATSNGSRVLGPSLGGILLAAIGLDGAFLLSVAIYLPALVAVIGLPRAPGSGAGGPGVLASVAEGFAFVRREPRLIGALVVTLIFNLFGWPSISMIPVIGQDRLALGPGGIGILAGMDGFGAFLGAILVALTARPHQYRAIYLGGLSLYFVMMPAFAFAPEPLSAGIALLLAGVGGAGFAIMQPTLVLLATPTEMRSRMMGLISVCIGLGPIGFLLLGGLAESFGASVAVGATGLAGLVVLGLARPWWGRI